MPDRSTILPSGKPFHVDEPLRSGTSTSVTLGDPGQGLNGRASNGDVHKQSNLTSNQLQVWLGQSLLPETPIYNLAVGLTIRGNVDPGHFQSAFQTLVRSSDALRTVLEEIDGIPIQRTLPHVRFSMDYLDFTVLPDPRGEAKRWMQERGQAPLNWETRLFDTALIKLSDKEVVWYLNLHHLVCDGWSFELIYRHMSELYQRSLDGQLPESLRLPLFADYLSHERSYRESPRYQKSEAYWKQKLSLNVGPLSFYGKVPDKMGTGVRRVSCDLGPDRTKRLRSMVASAGAETPEASLLQIFAAILVAYLHFLNGKESYTIGIPFHNRRSKVFKETIGFFSEILPVRVDVDASDSFASLIGKFKTAVFEAAKNGQCSVSNPYFRRVYDVVVNHHTRSFADFAGMPAFPEWLPSGHGDESLALQVSNFASSSSLTLDFDLHQDAFGDREGEQVLSHYLCVLDGFLANPNQSLGRLSLLSSEEARDLLAEWKATATDHVEKRCAHRIIEEQVRARPEGLAVLFEHEQLTYGELNWRANQLAHFLEKRGIGPGMLVGLYLERSPEMIVGLLAILKAGAAYVPIETKHPQNWLRFVLEDSQAALVLTQKKLTGRLPRDKVDVICLDAPPETLFQESGENLNLEIKGDDLAYLIYTSGSTGNPKGVEIPHEALANFTSQAGGIFGLGPTDRVLQFASISFDTSVEEIFPCLMRGATLVLRTDSMLDSIFEFVDGCRDWGVTVLDLPTAYWHEFAARLFSNHLALPDSIRLVIIGGERAIPERLALWQMCVSRQVRLLNTYGPTETTVVATVYDLTDYPVEGGSLAEIPIGCPMLNVQAFVLDRNWNPVPVGVPGELYIGGLGLARGYLNQPDLTAERFIKNPFSENPRSRLYRTGDLVRYRFDGDLEFVGRVDRQIKIRGFRVELDGIEAALRNHPLVQDAVVLNDNDSHPSRLVAYLVPKQAAVLNTEDIKSFIKAKLPEYMIPSVFFALDSLPLTPNGKVDLRSLVELDRKAFERPNDRVPPQTDTEIRIAAIWRDVLGSDHIGRYEHFFDVGGHSLLAMQVISRLRKEMQVEIPLRALFEAPTVVQLAERVDEALRSGRKPVEKISNSVPSYPAESPVSFCQARIWFMHQLAPESSAYNIAAPIRFTGILHKQALKRSLETIVQRHESLRTTFRDAGGTPVQVIAQARKVDIPEIDLSALPDEIRMEEAKRLLAEEGRRPFDLERGPVFRLILLKLGEQDHILLLSMHHVISDQWSLSVIARELTLFYNGFCNETSPSMNLPPAQYADFATWENQRLTPEQLQAQLSYWKTQLADLKPVSIPTDCPRPSVQTFHGAHQSLYLSKGLVDRLRNVALRDNVTLYMLFLTAFKVLLSRYSSQEDIAVGSPVSNRTRLEWENVVGTFVNILVLRADLSGHLTFREALGRVRNIVLDAFAHQEMPFEHLVKELQRGRDASFSPLVQILFNFQGAPAGNINLLGLSWMPVEIDQWASQFDIGFTVDPEITKKIFVSYNTELFQGATIKRMLDNYRTLLEAVAVNADQEIARIPILANKERQQLFTEWKGEEASFPRSCVHELFETRVQESPTSVAVVFEDQRITYADLNRRANSLAHRLRAMGVGPEVAVGVCIDRSPELIVGLLGILKAGGAYVPIDPAYPAERIAFMIEDSGMTVLLIQKRLLDSLISDLESHLLDGHVVLVDDFLASSEASPAILNFQSSVSPDNAAYLIYTSGSTGKPKGVEIEHKALSNFLHSMREKPGLVEDDVLLSVTTVSFDIAALELFLPLTMGARVVIAPREVAADGRRLAEKIHSSGATVMQATPATWRMLIETGWMGARGFKVLCGGEALSADLAKALLNNTGSVWNLYGPTETTIWSTVWQVEPNFDRVSIGKPIHNTKVYVLDRNLEAVPIGVPGELYIGGDGVARGYLNRPELTAEKFVASPFKIGSEERLFRTGDLVRYLPDGNLEWLGRLDRQLKIRGHRIELGEIEAILGEHPAVRQVVVIGREQGPGEMGLVAYLVTRKEIVFDRDELRNFLARKVPQYAVPSAFVFLDALPKTPNGKVNRQALPPPDPTGVYPERTSLAPRDRLEFQLTRVWEMALNVKPISIRDNFFELGGHSLIAVRLLAQIEEALGASLPLNAILKAPTVEGLASIIREIGWLPPKNCLVEMRGGGSKPPVFLIHSGYASLVNCLHGNEPIYSLSLLGLFEKNVVSMRIEEIAARYIESVRTLQPTGPYFIAGHSAAGMVAFEMAKQLHSHGDEIALLALFDTHGPSSKPLSTLKKLCSYLSAMRQMHLREKLQYAMAKWGGLKEQIIRRLWHIVHWPRLCLELPLALTGRNINMIYLRALRNYKPQVYPGQMTLFRATRASIAFEQDPQLGWNGMATGGLKIYEVPGNHFDLLEEPHVESTAALLSACLREAQTKNEEPSVTRASVA